MNPIEKAMSAVRGEMRHLGIDPKASTTTDAEKVLDDLGRKGIESGLWYWKASDAQINKFKKEWNKWTKQK